MAVHQRRVRPVTRGRTWRTSARQMLRRRTARPNRSRSSRVRRVASRWEAWRQRATSGSRPSTSRRTGMKSTTTAIGRRLRGTVRRDSGSGPPGATRCSATPPTVPTGTIPTGRGRTTRRTRSTPAARSRQTTRSSRISTRPSRRPRATSSKVGAARAVTRMKCGCRWRTAMRRAMGSAHTPSRSTRRRLRSQISKRCSGGAQSGSALCAGSRCRAENQGRCARRLH
mmetsp:Transcript_16666/g.43793  ORF Transcript_16666/g.43793 Transcript_16666/m.43793 type:complete len:227 (-) Transcript_16666:72-752(-)